MKILVALRQPSSQTSTYFSALDGSHVVLVPAGCPHDTLPSSVECALPGGPFASVPEKIVTRLALGSRVPAYLWRNDDLVIDRPAGRLWYRGIEIGGVDASSHSFKFALEVARAGPHGVAKDALAARISPARRDDEVPKKAKHELLKAIRRALEAAGQPVLGELATLFTPASGGYVLRGSAFVHDAEAEICGDAAVTRRTDSASPRRH